MAVGGWLSGGAQSSLLHAYLESSASASTATALSDHSDGDRKCGRPYTWHKRCRSKTTSTADTLRALTGSLGALCASVITRMRTYLIYSTRLRATSSSAVPVEDHHHQQRQSSFNCQRRPRLTQQQSQKRRDGAVGAADEPVCGTARRPLAAWMPALCAGVVAVLCYVNSLDGDFVHDDMVAVVGNPDVTGESRRHAASSLSSSSSLWINDFWGRPMADPRSHKSYRPLTVLTFSSVSTCENSGKLPTEVRAEPRVAIAECAVAFVLKAAGCVAKGAWTAFVVKYGYGSSDAEPPRRPRRAERWWPLQQVSRCREGLHSVLKHGLPRLDANWCHERRRKERPGNCGTHPRW
ncbi:hypothetical protein HPB51_026724 [Rhipicephalus microplus]|uniref:Uncharacterized protein n=1 Tax=Rhipicephalus microplus TaxID=6941 RepID=A0A9J6D1Y5_RHIMP|nr:hypothetical protein HPB51_026724 [Rhipicephalus microplus]